MNKVLLERTVKMTLLRMIKNVSLILSGRFKSTQPDGKQFGLPYLRQIRNNTYVDATPEVHPVPVRKSNIHYSFSEN